MKTVFVSAMYTDLHGTEMGGRPGRTNWYRYGLESYNALNLEIPIQVFAKQKVIQDSLSSYRHIKGHPCELDNLPFHDKIMEIKENNKEYVDGISWMMRSPHIMYGKIHWIMDRIENMNLSDSDYIFWIDAGLPHCGIFPFKCSTTASQSKDGKRGSYNFDKVFNEKFVNKLKEVSRDRILTIGTTEPNAAEDIPHDMFRLTDTRFYHYTIGGLFGGKVGQMKSMCNEFMDINHELLRSNILATEEQILTKMVKYNDDKYTKFEFGSWYHEDFYADGYYNPELRSFYKVFTEDLGI